MAILKDSKPESSSPAVRKPAPAPLSADAVTAASGPEKSPEELYKAMQLGLAKKEARVNELKERAKKLKKDGVMDEKGRLIPAAADAAPAKKTKKKK